MPPYVWKITKYSYRITNYSLVVGVSSRKFNESIWHHQILIIIDHIVLEKAAKMWNSLPQAKKNIAWSIIIRISWCQIVTVEFLAVAPQQEIRSGYWSLASIRARVTDGVRLPCLCIGVYFVYLPFLKPFMAGATWDIL